ncbi:MAG: hypothetical protein LUM44_03395 [Pyrinomonadaceae bacterium]|nr:hypothetical protein [Pyrinomonadaceae bacterium]
MMRNTVTNFSMMLICFTQMFLMPASVFMQKVIEETKNGKLPNECVELKLTTASDILNKNVPVSVTAVIFNKCAEKIEFLYRPSFILDKVTGNAKAEKIFGQTRFGVIFRGGAFEPFNTKYNLSEGQELEFVSNTSELKWMDAVSSQELFADTFEGLETGKYDLQAAINLISSDKEKKTVKKVYSNKVRVSYKASN